MIGIGMELTWYVGKSFHEIPPAPALLLVACSDPSVDVVAGIGKALIHVLSILAEVHMELSNTLPNWIDKGGYNPDFTLIKDLNEAELAELLLATLCK